MKLPLPALVLLATLFAAGCATKQNTGAAPQSQNTDGTGTQRQVTSFITRLAYAKANAKPVLYTSKEGTLSCIVYTVTQGADGGPGYSAVVVTDQGYAPIASIVVLCDTAAIDPARSIRCSGHILAVQNRWLTVGGDGMVAQFGLGKGDPALTLKGPVKTTPI
jgi:hypothetical protein